MSTSVDRFDERARRAADRFGETVVHRGELLRHPVYTRVLHWSVAIFFVLSLISGFAIYSPVALSLADPAVWRRPEDASAASLVRSAVRPFFLFSVSELAGADGLDRC